MIPPGPHHPPTMPKYGEHKPGSEEEACEAAVRQQFEIIIVGVIVTQGIRQTFVSRIHLLEGAETRSQQRVVFDNGERIAPQGQPCVPDPPLAVEAVPEFGHHEVPAEPRYRQEGETDQHHERKAAPLLFLGTVQNDKGHAGKGHRDDTPRQRLTKTARTNRMLPKP